APGLPGWHSVQVELRLEPLQLHAAPGLRGVPSLRRLVRPQRAEVVQGPGAAGLGRGARADRGRLRGAGGSGDLARGPGVVTRSTAGGFQARPPLAVSLSRVHRLTKKQARRIAVRAQLLNAPRPKDLFEVVE